MNTRCQWFSLAIWGFRRWQYERKHARRGEINVLQAELERKRKEYLRFVRGNGTDPNEHSRIIRDAQEICDRALIYEDSCSSECMGLPTETNADLGKFKELNAKCKHNLAYISKKWLTDNQVTKEVNWLECEVWGEYQDRNMDAFDAAIKRLEHLKNK
jgi:hypothetical protein